MTHLGDICKMNGAEIPSVDVITFGSPCQDFSVAGNREGLDGEESVLIKEALRVFREMREATNGEYPKYVVWENVPGAFSSNKGEDLYAIICELIRIVDPDGDVPRPPGGKWNTAGRIMGDGYSLAWRTFDAQFWGVPQRRRRIALVLDLRGESAPEILFVEEGLRGYLEKGRTQGQGVAADVEGSTAYTMRMREGCIGGGKGPLIQKDKSGTLKSQNDQTVFCLQGNGIDRADTAGCNGNGWKEGTAYILNTIDRHAVYDARGNGDGEIAPTMTGDHNGHISDYTAVAFSFQGFAQYKESDVASTMKQRDSKEATDLVVLASGKDSVGTLLANCGTKLWIGNQEAFSGDYFPIKNKTVRRLTPLECERLQGYPDGWTDIQEFINEKGQIKKITDSHRYKALGNSIALPQWRFVLGRISEFLELPATLGSMFDGIGGFPLVWEEIHGKGSAVWASEIEPFPIAVTKYHFQQK